MFSHHRRFATATASAALFAGLLVAVQAAPSQAAPSQAAPSRAPGASSSHRSGLPAVYPTPQSMTARGPAIPLSRTVAVVTGDDSDASAVAVVRKALTDNGVRVVGTPAAGLTAIYVGGPDENAASAAALSGLKVKDATALPAEGYVLADGRVNGRAVVVLDGKDATGTYYAAQTLRQLITKRSVPGVDVRDWPGQSLRGVIEGFYGTPWSDSQRLAQMDFYGAHKMNSYVYSPKDDAYLRAQWRDSYPPAQLAVLKTLVDRATADHVQFTYALSPGLSVCYSSASDEQALVAKFQSLWDIGVRSFSIPLDDISYTNWNCDADKTKFGTGGGAAGAAQSYLLNAVQRDFIATHPGAERLQMVPTEYSDVASSAYKTAIKADLDSAVVVGWTGVGVIAPTITTAQAAQAKSVYGHDILLWDNYPVNDYVTDRLLLGPYVGRSADLTDDLYGITANPMIQPEASKLALFEVADYTWNSAAYDPDTSYQASLTELAGGGTQARAALAAFADLEHSSRLDATQAPVLAAKTAAFWPAWEGGSRSAVGTLDGYLRVIENAQSTLTARMHDAEFVSEAQPWLQSTTAWGGAARAALRMLVDERAGRASDALADRAKALELQATAKSYSYVGLGGTVHVTVGDGVIDTFIANALAENNRWLGLAGRSVSAITSLGTYQSYGPASMVDGDASTYYWSDGSPSAGDYVGVDLGATQPISTVTITGGDAASPSDYIHVGTLEYSVNGTTWTSAGTFTNQATVNATLPAGTQARYVRLRATEADSSWVKIHEFTVTGPDSARLTVAGAPAAAAGSTLAAAADGNVDTAYQAAAAPAAGDALTVTLPKARALDHVGIAGTGSAVVQIQVNGAWRSIGRLARHGAYTELDVHGATATAIRLAWDAGSSAPRISEVVPWYGDVAAVDLVVTPATPDASAGTAATVTAQLTATQPRDVRGTLSTSAARGVSIDPRSTGATVYRGSQRSVPISLSSRVAGTYPVTVSFRSGHAAAVTQQVSLVVHPKVSTTNVAAAAQGATATASSVEQNLPQFTPDHAIDGDLGTRWSSGYTDGEWLQVQFAQPQNLGKVVITWEAAHASSYAIQTSTDGTTWTTALTVTGSLGGTETEWINATGARYLRIQGIARVTAYGYSIYELEAYPLA